MSGPGRAAHPSGQESPLIGRLLVSPPSLLDPNFRHRVVLMLAHTSEGAFGLVLNDPLPAHPVGDLLDDGDGWAAWCAEPAVVFRGGPVALSTVVALGRCGGGGDGAPHGPSDLAAPWAWLLGCIGTVDLEGRPSDVVRLGAVRIFAGYAGWGPGQLEGELGRGDWYVLDADPHDAFTDRPEELWAVVLRRSGGEPALVSTHPPGEVWN
jgi:putative transcriptional regulator